MTCLPRKPPDPSGPAASRSWSWSNSWAEQKRRLAAYMDRRIAEMKEEEAELKKQQAELKERRA
jgi:hypothetical protein